MKEILLLILVAILGGLSVPCVVWATYKLGIVPKDKP